ncbi:MAG TPA: YpdA family putative bacillithiol disulfide reductase [Vicinamibacterales bacterium]|nr:YpdA family putative bacillithiol disulfide reductase [Vicinamibacterales bacterium]
MPERRDVVVIGAGPVGLACAIELRRRGLGVRVLDKGTLVNSIFGYPTNMEFFSTPDLIEIGGYPFPVRNYKPTREDALEYYRGVAAREQIELSLYDRAERLDGDRGRFVVHSTTGEHPARCVIVSTGFFDFANRLGVPGEDRPNVTHYYKEPFPYVGQDVAVVGARNSAAKAALDCYRHGARVTLIVRGAALSEKIKYWLKPDLENRIKEGSIVAFFNTTLAEIRPGALLLNTPDGAREIPNQWVLAMSGYHPDFELLQRFGVTFADDPFRTPLYDETTFETRRPGVYIAGTVCGGYQTGRWFIENGRFHARQIAEHIAGEHVERIPFEQIHWKTQE